MPTEFERSATSPSANGVTTQSAGSVASAALIASESSQSSLSQFNEDGMTTLPTSVMDGDMSTSQTSTTSNSSSCNGGRKTSITSPDPTAYVAKARVTRPTPPPPPYNPMQFVQIKPCNLYQTAQEQLKKAEEVKKIKEIRKEEPEDWQNNLDNWKSSRRKRVEHIIDRVVEVKKLELEEHDRTRRKSKTFSEMIEDRVERVGRPALKKLASLAVYNEDESNDLSDLGIGTSSASGKSSLSEDYDNNSVMSDNAAELDKAISNSNHKAPTDSTTREYISSPGYETSSSTAPASTPDPCEYTYEGAIQDYKQRVSRAAAASGQSSQVLNKLAITTQPLQNHSKESTPERACKETISAYPPRRGSKIEDRLIGFEVQSPSEECVVLGEKTKVDLPKIDISKRKEIFESQAAANDTKIQSQTTGDNRTIATASGVPRVTLRDRFKPQETSGESSDLPAAKKDVRRMSGDITSIKERLQSLEQQKQLVNGANGGANKSTANKLVDIPVPPLKERLSSLQNAVTKEEVVRKAPVALVDARQLEIMKIEEEKAKQQTIKKEDSTKDSSPVSNTQTTINTTITTTIIQNEFSEVDRDDSGIHTADDIDVPEDRLQTEHIKQQQELKLNAAIEALAMEEKQFAEAANAVNQIEAEFEELTLGSSVALPPLASSNGPASTASSTSITNDHMEYSVSSTNQQSENIPCLDPTSNNTKTNPPSQSIDTSNRSSDNNNNNSLLQNSVVKGNITSEGADDKALTSAKITPNLRRKPTNEMVHAKNLLRIFKDTFQNDIELDEDEDRQEHETKNIPEKLGNDKGFQGKLLHLNLEKMETPSENVVDSKKSSITQAATTPSKTPLSPILSRPNPSSPQPISTTMIPRCVTPSGKPPMSPLTIRSTTKFREETPPNSPLANRKHDSQFSINGRVEIFNSKNYQPKSPIITTKITYLPQITPAPSGSNTSANVATPKNSVASSPANGNIILPPGQQQQQQPSVGSATEITTTSTVIQPPLSTEQAMLQTIAAKKSLFEAKSMPSRQMGNEPRVLDKAHGPASSKAKPNQNQSEAMKHQQPQLPTAKATTSPATQQQQQQQQPTEVVVCAPPITIVNPDELPKPNTVKNLSSCFQQHDVPAAAGGGKLISPKPMAMRSRIPQATPPQSPITVKRTNGEKSTSIEVTKNGSSNPLDDDEKKLSVISSSSSSSTTTSQSTASTVIEVNKTLSVMSNTSTLSRDSAIIPPTIVETNAQIHNEPRKEEKEETQSIQIKSSTKEETNKQELSKNKTNDMKKVSTTSEEDSKIESLPPKDEEKSCKSTPSHIQKSSTNATKASEASTNSIATPGAEVKSLEDIDMKALMQDFLQTEIQFSETCETNPLAQINAPFMSKLEPLKMIDDVEDQVYTPIASSVVEDLKAKDTQQSSDQVDASVNPIKITPGVSLPQSKKPPLTIDVSHGNVTNKSAKTPISPISPTSPASQLFRTTKPLVVSTLYDKYVSNDQKSPMRDMQPPSNMRPVVASNKPKPKSEEEKNTVPSIVVPAELPHLVDCPANDSTLFKLASSAPHSPISSPRSPLSSPSSPRATNENSMDMDSALCSSILTSMAATPDFVNFDRQHTVEEEVCQKIDVDALPADKQIPITGFKDISKTDIKQTKGLPKVICKMQDAPATPRAVEEELCQKVDVHSLPDDKQQHKTAFKAVSPTEIKKCDNALFGTFTPPHSPITEARAAHSKALIETCEKIIAEEKEVNNQWKSTLPSLSPKTTPVAQRKSKIPKPLPNCCTTTESMNEADVKNDKPVVTSRQSQPSSPKDDAVIARMHVVETQIKVTTTTPPTSPKLPTSPKPQASPHLGRKTKNIFDFLKKNFGVGHHKEEEPPQAAEVESYKPLDQPSTSPIEPKAIVLTEKDLQSLNQVQYNEIHNVDNSKFYLPADDVAPPPLPKTPAPVNIEITRKIITNEILEDGKTEMELTSEIDALLDVELNKLNHEIEELDKAAVTK
ncbi:smallish isoform X1 [Haematobia irritans]|uniref:smallish isoform X1 n=1 Tax=Haematobia irritans TaxID=7368 RepID=UPI003F5011F1